MRDALTITIFLLLSANSMAETWQESGNYSIDWYDAGAKQLTITTAEELAGLAYLVNNGNGSIRLNATQDIVFAGAYYERPDYDSSLDYNTRSWLFSIPRAFLTIEADQAEVIRNLQTDVDSFEHVYTEPGSYTVTFVGSNTVGFPDPGKNYQESSTQVKEFILNIIPPVLEVPGGSQSE